MEQKPFRHRHDGWTPARQVAFLDALRRTGCVTDACRQVGLSTTSARRAYKRMPDFARAWDLALRFVEPELVEAAYARAVTGWEEPVFHKGEVVGHRRRWSDAMLRMLLQREWRREQGGGADGGRDPAGARMLPPEEMEAVLMKRLAAVETRLAREAREAAAAAEAAAAGGEEP